MIRLPKRSVTRFFIPLIDVLILLFCIFLLMPVVKSSGDDETSAQRSERLAELEGEIERLRREGRELPPEVLRELEELRQAQRKTLQDRLTVRILQISPVDGRLYYYDPEAVEVRDQADAVNLINRDREALADSKRELYYLILYPRDPDNPYPLAEQREKYDGWFAGVPHGWDVPGPPGGAGRGGKP